MTFFLFKKVDWRLVFLIFCLFFFQILILFVLKDYIKEGRDIFIRAVIYCLLSILLLLGLANFFDFNKLKDIKIFTFTLYFVSLALLLYVLIVEPIKGSKRWLEFGFITLQPSEFVKIPLIFLYAKFFSKRYFEAYLARHIVGSFIYLLPIIILIIIEPDFSMALLFILYWFFLLLFLKIKPIQLIAFVLFFLTLAFFSWNYILKDYQKERINGFLFPYKDPLGSGYNIIQSRVAISSGGLWGKGVANIDQAKYGFLPNAYNDFIFSTIIEGFGLVGGIYVVIIYWLMIEILISYLSETNSNASYKIFILSFIIFFALSAILNIGGALGILPVSGNSLPFLSYGGSGQLSYIILIGIILNMRSNLVRTGGSKLEIY